MTLRKICFALAAAMLLSPGAAFAIDSNPKREPPLESVGPEEGLGNRAVEVERQLQEVRENTEHAAEANTALEKLYLARASVTDDEVAALEIVATFAEEGTKTASHAVQEAEALKADYEAEVDQQVAKEVALTAALRERKGKATSEFNDCTSLQEATRRVIQRERLSTLEEDGAVAELNVVCSSADVARREAELSLKELNLLSSDLEGLRRATAIVDSFAREFRGLEQTLQEEVALAMTAAQLDAARDDRVATKGDLDRRLEAVGAMAQEVRNGPRRVQQAGPEVNPNLPASKFKPWSSDDLR
ncbi:MAG: hypothetical protein AUK47_00205 [Deltaproteobacteria bacterium CG2_30_63_29]|nr:MAG: hypothetical protein AUK47_00205 [Deltaproteobacteria bacterium CG2_30_63_29]